MSIAIEFFPAKLFQTHLTFVIIGVVMCAFYVRPSFKSIIVRIKGLLGCVFIFALF